MLRCSACCRPPRTWITFNRFSTFLEVFLPHFHLHCTHCVVAKSLLNHSNSFCGGMFMLKTKFDADSLFYSLSHFECNCHTAHMLTQWHLLPPMTSTVKSSLFTHAHSSPLSLAARLHRCHATVLIILTDLMCMCVCVCEMVCPEKDKPKTNKNVFLKGTAENREKGT